LKRGIKKKLTSEQGNIEGGKPLARRDNVAGCSRRGGEDEGGGGSKRGERDSPIVIDKIAEKALSLIRRSLSQRGLGKKRWGNKKEKESLNRN